MKIKNPLPLIKHFFKNEPQIWISFAIPFVIMIISYLVFGVYPIKVTSAAGDRVFSNSVLSLDLNAQYVYYFAYMKDVFAGNESLFYSWGRNLSGEFVGIIGYYLFSPFNLIVWAFPLSHITEGLLLMIVTKIGSVGALMAVYLSKGRKLPKTAVIIFSVMYALTSYNIVQTMNPMWLDGVMILPIIALGVEALMREGRYKLLIFSLFYAFVTCFYIGYMLGIFAAMYFVYYALASRKATTENTLLILKRGGMFAGAAVIAVLSSCFMLLPVYSSLSMGKFEFSDPDYSMRTSFTFLEMTSKLFPNSYDTVRPQGLPFLYCGTLAAVLLPIYFFCSRIRRAKRVAGAVLLIVLGVCMYITPVDMFWHGGQVPNWLPYRYSFVLCFLVLAFGADVFTHIQKIPHKAVGLSALAFAGLMLYWEQANTFVSDLGNSGRDVLNNLSVVLPAFGILVLITAYVFLTKDKLNKKKLASIVLIVIVSLEMYYNTQFQIVKQNTDIVYSTRDSFNNIILPTREVADEIQKNDPGFYRMEKTFSRTVNEPLALGMKGISHSSSMLNDEAILFLKRMGYSARSHASYYRGETPISNDLMGFRYTLSCLDNNVVNIKSAEDIEVVKNETAMPLAYIVDNKIANLVFDEDDVFFNQSLMLSLMLGEEQYVSYYKEMPSDDILTQNLEFARVGEGHDRYEKSNLNSDAYIDFFITAQYTGSYYMYLPTRYDRRCDLYVNDVRMGVYFESDNLHIKYLGEFKAGEEFKVRLKLQRDKVFFRNARFVWFDEELYNKDIQRLHEMNQNTVFEAKSNTRLQITTNYHEAGVLFTSIPMEPGWTIRINGKKVTPYKLADALIALEVPAGENIIEFSFFPNYMPVGISLSFLGASAVLFMNSIMFKLSLKRKRVGIKRDDYDGYDEDYIDYDNEYVDFNFDDLENMENENTIEEEDSDIVEFGEDFEIVDINPDMIIGNIEDEEGEKGKGDNASDD
ncbi:MAG: YfhO family protein [Oscillospiraceae bacterium]|nr:YfhO family protein [Oscillospiraceae bacterium]